jgi:HEAT repeat protein
MAMIFPATVSHKSARPAMKIRSWSVIYYFSTVCLLPTFASCEPSVSGLSSNDPQTQIAAIIDSVKAGRASVPALCDLIETSPDALAKRRAAMALAKITADKSNHVPSVYQAVERLTHNPNPLITRLAIAPLMNFKGHSEAIIRLRQIARQTSHSEVRVQALGALVFCSNNDPSEGLFLESFLDDASEYVRIQVAGFLGIVGNKKGLPLCRDVLSREPANDQVRGLQMRAAISAGHIGDQSLLPALQKLASSSEYGLAQGHARTAILQINLAEKKTSREQIEFLLSNLRDASVSRWCIQKLVELAENDPRALTALEGVAKDHEHTSADDAAQAIRAYRERNARK